MSLCCCCGGSGDDEKTESPRHPTVRTGRVLTVGTKAATVEDTNTRRQYYAPFHAWGSILHTGQPVLFEVDPQRSSGVHRVESNTFPRLYVSQIVRAGDV